LEFWSSITIMLIVVIALMVAAADRWIHIHRQQLSAFNQFRVGTQVVCLDIEEEPTST
jgi:hypothetical protein